MGDSLTPELHRVKEGSEASGLLPKVGAVFEELGFTYMGPVDGHNLQELINTFKEAHKHVGPVLVHVATTKGKGYAIAEKDQVGYHAQSPFNLSTGKSLPSNKPKAPQLLQGISPKPLIKLAEDNP